MLAHKNPFFLKVLVVLIAVLAVLLFVVNSHAQTRPRRPRLLLAQTVLRPANIVAFRVGVPEEQIVLARAVGAVDKDIQALAEGYGFENLMRDLQSKRDAGISSRGEEKEYPVLFIIKKGTHFHGQSGYGYNVTLMTGKLLENKQGRETSLLCDGLLTPHNNLLKLRLEKPRHYKLGVHEFGKEKPKETSCKE